MPKPRPRARATAPARLAVLVALAAAVPARVHADAAEDLRNDAWRAAATTAGALLADGLLSLWKETDCRICTPPPADERVREALRWSDPAAAGTTSDVLANVAIPLLAAADAVRSTRTLGDAGRDVLVVAEAASLSSLATSIAKNGFARRRPGLPATGPTSPAGNQSLWSGHTALAFSVAVAQAMQDTLRGDPAAPWAWTVGLVLAGTVGYLRIAGDAHWLTDVLAGAAVGTAFGIAVPMLEVRLVRGVTLAPAPGGIAIRF